MSTTAFKMHMARTGGAEVLKGREVSLPPPGPGEARVAIEAAGVAFADIVMRTGFYPGVKAPVTPGYDFVGRIEALGPGVEGFAVGQRVAALTVDRLLRHAPQHRGPLPGRRPRGRAGRGPGRGRAERPDGVADVSPCRRFGGG